MEAARAVKMPWQNMREQNKLDEVFRHCRDQRKRTAYQPTDLREYFSAEYVKML